MPPFAGIREDPNVDETMSFRHLIPALLLMAASPAFAQRADQHLELGDREYAARRAEPALAHYIAAAQADSLRYEAWWKASRSAVDLAEYHPDAKRRAALFDDAVRQARKAVALRPGDAEGHFVLARALGRVALSKGVRDRIDYAKEIRALAITALELQPDHPGARHVLARWNAEVMRVNGVARFLARKLLGGEIFGLASWADARRHMERAVAVDPDRLVHRLGLAEIYLDMREPALARAQLERVVAGAVQDYNDPHYQREAARLLDGIR